MGWPLKSSSWWLKPFDSNSRGSYIDDRFVDADDGGYALLMKDFDEVGGTEISATIPVVYVLMSPEVFGATKNHELSGHYLVHVGVQRIAVVLVLVWIDLSPRSKVVDVCWDAKPSKVPASLQSDPAIRKIQVETVVGVLKRSGDIVIDPMKSLGHLRCSRTVFENHVGAQQVHSMCQHVSTSFFVVHDLVGGRLRPLSVQKSNEADYARNVEWAEFFVVWLILQDSRCYKTPIRIVQRAFDILGNVDGVSLLVHNYRLQERIRCPLCRHR